MERCAGRIVRSAAVTLAAWLVGVHTAPAAAQEVIDRVLAIAGNHVILASDVSAARVLGLVSVESAPDPIRDGLSRLVDRALVLGEVDRYAPPEPEDAAIARDLQVVRSRFASSAAFAAALAGVGLEETHLREHLRQDLRIASYLDQRFVVTQPTDAEIEEIYRAEPARFTHGAALATLEEARPVIVRALVDERRATRVEEWIAGLRRRSLIVDLY